MKAEKSVGNAPDQLKRLKIEASMAQVALKKAEKQLATHDTDQLRAQVAELRIAAEQAKAALAAAESEGTNAAPAPFAAPASDEAALKKAKIDAAMARAQLKKSEKASANPPRTSSAPPSPPCVRTSSASNANSTNCRGPLCRPIRKPPSPSTAYSPCARPSWPTSPSAMPCAPLNAKVPPPRNWTRSA